jgi:hypothetical protein
MIVAGFNGQGPRIVSKGKIEPLFPGEATAESRRSEGAAGDRNSVWVPAFQGGEPSPGNFLNAAAISDAVTLGTVALRAGRKVVLDSANMKITNLPEADKYLVREYRKGWEL